MGKEGFSIAKTSPLLMLINGYQKFHQGLTHKEGSDGMVRDVMSMWAETAILVSNLRLSSYSGREECAPPACFPSSHNYELLPSCQELC